MMKTLNTYTDKEKKEYIEEYRNSNCKRLMKKLMLQRIFFIKITTRIAIYQNLYGINFI